MVRLAILSAAVMLLSPTAAAAGCAGRLLPPVSAPPVATRAITPTDLVELRDFGPPDSTPGRENQFGVSPDGRFLAVSLRRADATANRYCIGLLLVATDTREVRLLDTGGEPILLTVDFRGHADTGTGGIDAQAPGWSPDGRSIAWLRRDHGLTRLWLVSPSGKAARPVTKGPSDVRRFAWSPDGRTLVYMVRPALREAQAAIASEGRSGHLYDLRFWPMSSSVPNPPAGLPMEIRAVDPATGHDRVATAAEQALLVPPSAGFLPRDAGQRARGPQGSMAWVAPEREGQFLGPRPLSARVGGRNRRCGHAACADRIVGLWWLAPDELLFLRDWGNPGGGLVELFRWRPGHAPISVLRTTDPLMDCQFAARALYCAREGPFRPRHVVRIAPGSGTSTTLFDPNPEFGAFRHGPVKRIRVRAGDGAPAYADLVLPPGHVAGQRHPLVVVQYQSRGFLRGGTGDEYPIPVLAERGYAVLSYHRPSPFAFGSATTSLNDFQRINIRGWGDRRRVFTALDAAVDAAISTGTVDPDALGITGMSEGASSAIWALLATRRYRAAAISSCCEDPYTTFYGNGLVYARDAKQWGYPLPEEDREGFWETYSLALGARRVTAPILLQMADREYRFALQAVGALSEAGKPVELYVFPDEYHMKWQPAHRLAIYSRTLDWFDFWLRGKVDPDPARAAQYARWRAMSQSAPEGSD